VGGGSGIGHACEAVNFFGLDLFFVLLFMPYTVLG